LSTLLNEINRLFEEPFSELGQGSQYFYGWVPAIDLFEDKENLIVKAELPGLTKNEIDISLHEGALSISGERKPTEPQEDSSAYRTERFYGRFQRTVALPKEVEGDKVKAAYNDGILTVTLPKAEKAKPKQIEIAAS
jgi:HSP20 family protein